MLYIYILCLDTQFFKLCYIYYKSNREPLQNLENVENSHEEYKTYPQSCHPDIPTVNILVVLLFLTHS